MKESSTNFLVKSGIIAASYAVLTLFLSPLSYGVMQIRVSEAMCVLAIFTPAAIPGLSIGCFISGILGPNGIVDALFGTFATLLGSLAVYALRKYKYLAPLGNVLANGVVIGSMLYFVNGIGFSLVACILWVSAGELLACVGLGSIITKYLSNNYDKFLNKEN